MRSVSIVGREAVLRCAMHENVCVLEPYLAHWPRRLCWPADGRSQHAAKFNAGIHLRSATSVTLGRGIDLRADGGVRPLHPCVYRRALVPAIREDQGSTSWHTLSAYICSQCQAVLTLPRAQRDHDPVAPEAGRVSSVFDDDESQLVPDDHVRFAP